MKIIADTNVWYHLSEGRYKHLVSSDAPLCLTAWTILELITSPKLLMKHERKKVIDASKAIINLNPFIIEEDPYSFIASNILGISNKSVYNFNITDLEKLVAGEISEEELKTYIQFRHERVNQFRNSVRIQQSRKLNSMQSNSLIEMNQLIEAVGQQTVKEVEKILGILETDINIEHLRINGNQINFFLWVRAIYNFKLDNEPGYKVEKNDQGDILNMIYVGQDDKYWTSDCKWLKNVIDSGLSKFIYSPITNLITREK